VLDPRPIASAGTTQAGFYYQNSGSPAGTFAFANPGATIALPLASVAIGDSIALPGSDVASVTYGAGSIAVVTSAGTTTFANVSYSGTQPTGFLAAADPISGLERITFATQQATAFQQTQTSNIISNGFTFGVYLWSTPANWTNGVPTNGAAVTTNVIGGGNPSGYDDIGSLTINSLNLISGFVAVGGAADLSHGASLEIGTVSFGSTTDSVYSDTNLGSPSATLVIDGFANTGTYGRIAATGANALTLVQSATDPGEIYQVDGGGELVLDPRPIASAGTTQAGFYYQNSGTAAGTFAFANPGTVITLPLASVAIGDSIALPGSDIASVTYGANSIAVVTSAGTTTFSNASFASNQIFTGFLASPDPQPGLERITFEGYSTTNFQQSQTTNIISNGFTFAVYPWSTPANWTNGVPANGGGVNFNIIGGGNPSGYDDIASLFLNTLNLTSGFVAVGGATNLSQGASLEIASVSFGSTTDSVYSDTNLGSPSATLVIDGFANTGTYGRIAATGANALTVVRSTTDPGEIYQVDGGGELVLDPTPIASAGTTQAGFYYQNSGSPAGTFAFANPGATIALPLASVAIGDSIALPGTNVSSVTFGSSTITVVTSAGTTTFSNVSYSGTQPTAFSASADPISGLERVTFATATSFLQTTTAMVNGTPQFLWSNATNWTSGAPVNGSTAAFSVSVASLGGYDDIGNLFLDSLHLNSGFLAVGGQLTIGGLLFSEAGGRGIEADTLINGGSAAVTIDAMSGAGATVAALGTAALTSVLTANDPGEIYQAANGGMVLLSASPRTTSAIDFNGGTFAFENPGSGIPAVLNNLAVGDAIELPGNSVSSVLFGTNSLTITTDMGATTFSDVSYGAPAPGGFNAAADPSTGLQEITFTLCFSAGTMIRTPEGDVPVEQLAVGDDVLTASGEVRPITWIGHRRIDCAHHPRPHGVWPVRVAAGTFGVDRPYRDLWLSPEHALFIDGVLVPVKHLIDGEWIVQAPVREVIYYHIELAQHDVLLAEGLPAESYLDTGDRACFDDGGVVQLIAGFRTDGSVMREWESRACAPLVVAGDRLEAVRAMLGASTIAPAWSTPCNQYQSRSAVA
jgi:Hint domain